MASAARHRVIYTAQPVVYVPKHGRPRTYWRASNGAWSCGHMHRCPETAGECAAALNGVRVVALRRVASQ